MNWTALKELYIASLIVGFGVYCVSQGHNSTIILSVFSALGAIGGYMFAKKEEPQKEKEE